MSIGRKRVELEARIPRPACQHCGAVRQAAIGFAEPRRTYTKSFQRGFGQDFAFEKRARSG